MIRVIFHGISHSIITCARRATIFDMAPLDERWAETHGYNGAMAHENKV